MTSIQHTRYEFPPGVTFTTSTPERAAVQAFGGRESDYVTSAYERHLEVMTADGEHVGDIPIVRQPVAGVDDDVVVVTA